MATASLATANSLIPPCLGREDIKPRSQHAEPTACVSITSYTARWPNLSRAASPRKFYTSDNIDVRVRTSLDNGNQGLYNDRSENDVQTTRKHHSREALGPLGTVWS